LKYQEEKVGCSGSVSSALPRIASRREASPLRDPRALRENFRAKRAAILSKVHGFLCQAKVVAQTAPFEAQDKRALEETLC